MEGAVFGVDDVDEVGSNFFIFGWTERGFWGWKDLAGFEGVGMAALGMLGGEAVEGEEGGGCGAEGGKKDALEDFGGGEEVVRMFHGWVWRVRKRLYDFFFVVRALKTGA